MQKVLASFSGGRSSAVMTWHLLNDPRYEYCDVTVMYANTGREREETLQFVKDCDSYWGFNTIWVEAVITQERGVGVKPKLVTFETATRIGEHGPFDDLIQKLGIPNPAKSGHCTRDLKITPMTKMMRQLGHKDYMTAIGIRADEPRRISKTRTDVLYPLNECEQDELFVRQFMLRQVFDLQLKDYQGNCCCCFKKSERKIMTCMAEDPAEAQWWIDHEEADTHGWNFARSHTPYKELRERALKGDFNPAVDKFAHLYEQPVDENGQGMLF